MACSSGYVLAATTTTSSPPSSHALMAWMKLKPGTSNHRMPWSSVAYRGMMPIRATLAASWPIGDPDPNIISSGFTTICVSGNTANLSVMAKSWMNEGCIIDRMPTSGSFLPSGLTRNRLRNGGTGPYRKANSSPVWGSSFGCAVMPMKRLPPKSCRPTVCRSPSSVTRTTYGASDSARASTRLLKKATLVLASPAPPKGSNRPSAVRAASTPNFATPAAPWNEKIFGINWPPAASSCSSFFVRTNRLQKVTRPSLTRRACSIPSPSKRWCAPLGTWRGFGPLRIYTPSKHPGIVPRIFRHSVGGCSGTGAKLPARTCFGSTHGNSGGSRYAFMKLSARLQMTAGRDRSAAFFTDEESLSRREVCGWVRGLGTVDGLGGAWTALTV
eukprot:TRINITY_DN664_c0_g1_i1.p2 TRINITY_DN664_c0_g1~~TRINITY_DN664_c0_g1_i1.p2  ORF type:complete len:386 (+),score=-73.75 TRINITY_DN664_c0_g1_i1:864-2021(+)